MSDDLEATTPDAEREPLLNGRGANQEPGPHDATIIELVDVVADRVDPILKLISSVMERSLKAQESGARFRTKMAWIAVMVVALVVGTASVLTYNDKLDGSTYGFLLGLVVGYVLTFVRDAITPSTD